MTNIDDSRRPRRRFLAQLTGAAAALAAVAVTEVGAQGRTQRRAALRHDHPLDAWMRSLTGMHRQFFHSTATAGGAGLVIRNYFDAYRDAYGADPRHVNAVLGVNGVGIVTLLNDAVWAKYGLGKIAAVTDPTTQQPSVRNIFASGSDTSIRALQERSLVTLICNSALRFFSGQWAPQLSTTAAALHEDFLANLLPGVIPVPAMVVAINRAQEAGFTYVRAT